MALSLFGFRQNAQSAETPNVEGNNAFAFDLYKKLSPKPGNLFFSPYSISTALAMTYAGAHGDTEKQMAQVLHFDGQDKTHAGFSALHGHLADAGKKSGIELNVANALWTQKGHPFLAPFLRVAEGGYQAKVRQADFATAAEKARAEINEWVEQQTKRKIQNILPPGSLNELTRLVLANAIYFKGTWATPFVKNETSDQPFYRPGASAAKVPLMHHFDQVKYSENDQFQAVELPYSQGALSMVILLPRETTGCPELETRLNPALLSRVISQMKKQKVEIFLPRFKLESGFELTKTLADMGMPDAFGPKSDFSGIDGTRQLYISSIFHKAWGEVNEEGTEAAAATTVAVGARSIQKPPPPPPVFRADHPFIFLIRETRFGSILFLGRLQDPS